METKNTTATSAQLRAQATACQQESAASFERCDTDGFASQAANTLVAAQLRRQATIQDNGGNAEFPALFDLDGNLVPAKLIQNKFGGMTWMVLDNNGKSTGEFINAQPKKRDTIANKGYLEGVVLRPAYAVIAGGGRGISGMSSCYIATVAKTKEHEAPIAIITTDRWA